MWEATVDGRELHFHLCGIRNQNFLMQDEETGSVWQQVSGAAILGPLRGRRLKEVESDELSYALWRRSQPEGHVLPPEERFAGDYAAADWEHRLRRAPASRAASAGAPDRRLPPRTLILGLSLGPAGRAYPLADLQRRSIAGQARARTPFAPLQDEFDGVPLLLLLAEDLVSARAFDRRAGGRTLTFLVQPRTAPVQVRDRETGSTWDFGGQAVDGPLRGQRLRRLPLLPEFWFDWKNYHPATEVYEGSARAQLGER